MYRKPGPSLNYAHVANSSLKLHGLCLGADYEGPHYKYSAEMTVLVLQGTAKLIVCLSVIARHTGIERPG